MSKHMLTTYPPTQVYDFESQAHCVDPLYPCRQAGLCPRHDVAKYATWGAKHRAEPGKHRATPHPMSPFSSQAACQCEVWGLCPRHNTNLYSLRGAEHRKADLTGLAQ